MIITVIYWTAALVMAAWHGAVYMRDPKGEGARFKRHDFPDRPGVVIGVAALAGLLWPVVLAGRVYEGATGRRI